MKGFIEVHDANNGNKARLVNINHIVEVQDNYIYTDDTPTFATDFNYIKCQESYIQICEKIKRALKGGESDD